MAPIQHDGTLADLMRQVNARVKHAVAIIDETDDADIIDREIQYIRPFWQFYSARRTFNKATYWERLQKAMNVPADQKLYRKTPLTWMLDRQAACDVTFAAQGQASDRIVRICWGIDLVVFNFLRLMGRMKYSLGATDENRFVIETVEADGGCFRLQRAQMKQQAQDGTTHLVASSMFQQPDGEAIKIERDSSQSATNPFVSITMFNDSDRHATRLMWDGLNSELKAAAGGQLRTRNR